MRGLISALPPRVPRRALARELQEDLFEIGLANIQTQQRHPAVLDGVENLPDVVDALDLNLDVMGLWQMGSKPTPE